MKKQLLSLAMLCAVAFASNAQTEKGDNMIGGSIAYSRNKQTPENFNNMTSQESTNFVVTPRFGHFVSNNLAIGLGVGYVRRKYFYESRSYNGSNLLVLNTENINDAFSIDPFVRYYVKIIDKFKFFGQGTASVAFGKSASLNGGSTTLVPQSTKYKTTTYVAAVYPGFAFFPTKHWAFEFSFSLLSYNKYKMKDDGNNVGSQAYQNEGFQFGLDSFNPSLGLNYHF